MVFFFCYGYGYGYDLVLRFPQRLALLLWGLPGIVSTLSAERLLVCFVAFFLGFSYLPTFSAFTPAFSRGLSWVEGIPPSTSYVSPSLHYHPSSYLPAPTFLPSPPSCLFHIHLSGCLNCAPFSFIYLFLPYLGFISFSFLLVSRLTSCFE